MPIREISLGEEEMAAEILAEAFASSKLYGSVMPRGRDEREEEVLRRRREFLRWFCKRRLGISRDCGAKLIGLFSEERPEVLESMLVFGPIESQQPSLYVKLKHGMLMWPFLFGLDSLRRMIALGEDFTESSMRANPHARYEIMMVATDQAKQGRGLSSRLLTHVIEMNEREAGGAPIRLSTQNEITVRFYERFGFKVTAKWKVFEGTPEEFDTWTMIWRRRAS